MNAVPLRVTTEALSASRKIYEAGQLHPGIRVPMRKITLHPSAHETPLRVYDSSGPYTDPTANIDIDRGLPRLREAWITARGDVEAYDGVARSTIPTTAYVPAARATWRNLPSARDHCAHAGALR